MTAALNDTHDPALRSWVGSANAADTEFPLQNLPFGRFRVAGEGSWRIGVAIGDQVLDLTGLGLAGDDMNALMAQPAADRQALRLRLSRGLRQGSADEPAWRAALRPIDGVELGLPCRIGDYTDFYTSIHHATTVGKQFRPDNPLLPNYKWVPIGYHGRSSSIEVSRPGLGHAVKRPVGQVLPAGMSEPSVMASARMDYELALGFLIAQPNDLGDPVTMENAEDHVFGVALFNDWTARDIQPWEYQPLGPFLSKNFASTLSPWVVTLEALAPFRAPFTRPAGDPAPLPYLDSPHNRQSGAINIQMEVWLQTERMRNEGHPGDRLMTSNAADAYWTVAQLVAHHTVNGCNLRAGDLLGSGTLSGPKPEEAGSLLEMTLGGKQPIKLSNGETRGYLADGDTVVMKAHCQREGFRQIGFGECRGTVQPARAL